MRTVLADGVSVTAGADACAWAIDKPAIGTVGGAIGNAVFAAAGKRIRTLPITPERVMTTPAT